MRNSSAPSSSPLVFTIRYQTQLPTSLLIGFLQLYGHAGTIPQPQRYFRKRLPHKQRFLPNTQLRLVLLRPGAIGNGAAGLSQIYLN